MSKGTVTNCIHPDLHVVHTIPGRIRLKARNLYNRAQPAEDVRRKLSAIAGLHHVETNSTTGSLTLHYHHSALDSITFFAEVATALGLIVEGIDPGTVESLFKLVGTSPADMAASLDRQHIVLPIATFALGLYIGRLWG
jgi:heavy-metal-associated domain-containing protein